MSEQPHAADLGTRYRYRQEGAELERERIVKNIQERVSELRACSKADNCQEFATLIESYIEEWIEREQNEL